MANRVVDVDLIQDRAVVERDGERVRDEALLRLVVVDAELLLLHALDLGAECINTGVRGSGIRAISKYQHHPNIIG